MAALSSSSEMHGLGSWTQMGEATSHQAWEDIPSWKRLMEETDAQSSTYVQMGYFENTKKSLKRNKDTSQQFVRKQHNTMCQLFVLE